MISPFTLLYHKKPKKPIYKIEKVDKKYRLYAACRYFSAYGTVKDPTLCGFVYERGLVPREFLDSVRAREVLAKTAFGNMVAMPHPIEVMGKTPFVCVCVLDEPILWTPGAPDSLIQVIFLVSVANYEHFDVQKFYQVTAKLLLDGPSMKELIRTPSYETLKHLLLKMEEQVEDEG